MSFKRGIKDAFNGLPPAVKTRMVKALAKRYGYSDTLPDGSPNPQGRLGFVAKSLAMQVAIETQMYFRAKDIRVLPERPRIDVGENGPDDATAKKE